MQKYIDQLLEDLQEAKKKDVPTFNYVEIEESENSFCGDSTMFELPKSTPCKERFGVSYEELPPSHMLTDAQMQQIISGLIDLWNEVKIGIALGDPTTGILSNLKTGIVFPENMPITFRYELLRYIFERDGKDLVNGFTFNFCDTWCPDCKLTNYCNLWKENWTLEKMEEIRNNY